MQPYRINFECGKKYFWCTCGLSTEQPFCDGSHKGTGKKSLCIEAEQDRVVWLCGCKQTQTPPYCDGSHKK